MVGSRTLTAVAGLLGSLALSVVAYVYFDTLLFFLFLPFVPLLFRRGGDGRTETTSVKTCPACGYRTRDPEFSHCPRDGTSLIAGRGGEEF